MEITYIKPDSPILVMGYDWEKFGGNENEEENKRDIEDSLKGIQTIFQAHDKYRAPFTLFALGYVLELPKQVENCRDQIKKFSMDSLVDIQQHAYSHTPFLKLPSKDKKLTQDEALAEVNKTSILIKEKFNRNCIGLRPPYGHYEGLQRDPELLEGLSKQGITFISSDLRNKDDQFPPEWTDKLGRIRQPYWYKNDDLSLFEIPTHGNADNLYRGVSKYIDTEALSSEEILNIHIDNLKKASKGGLIYVPLFHVWVVGRFDGGDAIISGLLEYAKKTNIRIMNYLELWKTYN